MAILNPKQTAQKLIEKLPDNATWDDVVYKMITRREIELGLVGKDIHPVSDDEDVIQKFSRYKLNAHC